MLPHLRGELLIIWMPAFADMVLYSDEDQHHTFI